MSSTIFIVIMFLVAGSMMSCSRTFGCIATERNALIKFKASFSDPSNRLSSWNTSTKFDCCQWQGVKCDAITRHVIALDLRIDYIHSDKRLVTEKLDSSILELKHLSFLDMSGNNFQRSYIPAYLGSMYQLQHLNISYANFSGVVPHHLGNLTRLSVLDLSHNYHRHEFTNEFDLLLVVDDLIWLSRLSLLTHLDMSFMNISRTKHLVKVLNMLPYLVDLGLSNCGLENKDLQHGCVINSTLLLPNIQYLDLSRNSFHGELPCFLENMTSLTDLYLSHNSYNSCNYFYLTGLSNLVNLDLSSNSYECNMDNISEFLPNDCNLESLNLFRNSFSGDVSRLFRLISSSGCNQKLATLDLDGNNFYGHLPGEIGRFGKLKYFRMQSNLITGPIPTSISNLSFLSELDLSRNKLNGSFPASFGNLTSLKFLNLENNLLGGDIPTSLGLLQNLETLAIGNNHFSGIISEAHFATLSMLQTLYLNDNLIELRVKSNWMPPFQLVNFDVDSCDISGRQFPKWLQTQKELALLSMRNCSISGPLPPWFWYKDMTTLYLANNRINGSTLDLLCEMTSLVTVDMSNNHIEGSLPHSLCEMTNLYALDLSMNRISGILPECSWANFTRLQALILSSNQLSGVIPNTIGEAPYLTWLQLSNNSLQGELPSTLKNCGSLQVLDFGQNAISGKLPKWVGHYLLELRVLRLVNNELYGTIPVELCQLQKLRVLDVANNKLTGYVPRCFGNFSEMMMSKVADFSYEIDAGLQLVMKGLALEYLSTLRFVRNMDLSINALEGEIPLELTRLAGLQGLNLSHNQLVGLIPGSIGEMNSLESLDLSNNNLSGNVPDSLSGLTSLSYLNLSYNNLTGQIPTGNQLQTLVDPWSYEGNPGLCGDTLPRKCHENKVANTPNAVTTQAEVEEKLEKIWFYGVVVSGFATGFWGAIGVLVFKRGWRFIYFNFVEDITVRIFG